MLQKCFQQPGRSAQLPFSHLSVGCRLQKHQAVMRRAQFPTCRVLPHGQAARVSVGYSLEAPLHHLLTREEKEVNGEEIIN